MAALTPNALIESVATQVESVSGVGVVHRYRREVRDEPTAAALWIPPGGNKVNAWSVTLAEPAANNTRSPGFGAVGSGQSGRVLTDFGIAIEAVYAIDDAAQSEVTFRDLVWRVALSFNKIGLLTADVVNQGPMQWERFGFLVLAGMYHVHYAKLRGTFMGQVAP
jgi:hypothetical protein